MNGGTGAQARVLWIVLAIVAAAAWLRFGSLAFHYDHPDEVIAVEVARSMIARGTLNTNWVEVAALPASFRVPQFNFSGYMLAAAAALQAGSWLAPWTEVDALGWLRGFSALLGTGVVLATFLVGRRWFGPWVGVGAAIAVAINPLLYQDGLYARPETFATLLTLGVAWLLGGPGRPSLRQGILAAWLLGVLVATKVSMLLLVPVLLLAIDPRAGAPEASWRRQVEAAWAGGRWLLLALGAGFLCGMPAVLTNAVDFLHGVLALRNQYLNGHWPHGVQDGTAMDRLAFAGKYFRKTTGFLVLLAFAGAAWASWRGIRRPVVVFLFAAATLLQFSVYAAFFERNVSHVVPVFAIFAMVAVDALSRLVRAPRWRPAVATGLAVALLLPSLRTSAVLRFQVLPPGVVQRDWEALVKQHPPEPGQLVLDSEWVADHGGVERQLDGWCGPVYLQVAGLGDPAARRLLEDLQRHGYRELGRAESPMRFVPSSTLHTYFTPTRILLTRPAVPETCRRRGHGRLPPSMVGAPLSVVSTRIEGNWAAGGAFPDVAAPVGNPPVYGSWVGDDTRTGRLQLVIDVDGVREIVLGYVSGPVPYRQRVRLLDDDTGKLLLDTAGVRERAWRYQLMRLPAGTRRVRLEATDHGTAWGEWHAVAVPRRFVSQPP